MRALILIAAALAGCGSSRNKAEGEVCVTAQECADGLLCDYGKTPHLCAKMDSVGRDMAVALPDMSVPQDLFGVDLRGLDLTVVIGPDLKPVPMDLAGPD
jgi:hypothetical protein